MPLLTHDETGAASMARAGAAALVEWPTTRSGGDGPRPAARRRSPWRRVRRWLLILLAVAVLGPVLAFVIGWMIFKVPTADDAAITQVATFTFADGAPLATVRPENVNRVNVTLDRVPTHVRQAVLAAEDRSFYSNPGFDIAGIGRAVYNQLTGGTGGGSTITQQYLKVSTGQDEFSLWRKYKEVVLAVKISREQTKDQILENYLNTIYLGRGAYGIQAASLAYFGKNVQDLTVSEGALLAGIIQSPSNWDPAKNLDQAQRRWTFVVDGMAEQQWITPGDRAAQAFPATWLPQAPSLGDGLPGDHRHHVYQRALKELTARGVTQQQIDTMGLTVTTTIQPALQASAAEAVTSKLAGTTNLRAALVSVDPRTGAILAYYGGENGLGTDYAAAERQPGSSFKPFVLAAALQGDDGIGLGTQYNGSSPQTFEGQEVNNSEGFDCAQCTVRTAMTRSINTIFYQLGLQVGIPKVIDAAHRAGIPTDLLPEVRGGTALGDQEVHPIDMASAYGTFAADGIRREPYIVSRVVAADGQVLYDREESTGERAFPQQVARNVTESMLDVPSTSRIGLGDGRPLAAKTGTVQLGKTKQNKDAWTVGFTPSISTAVWVGTDRSDPIKDKAGRSIFGRTVPGSIWQEFMTEALRGKPKEQFSKFVPIGKPPTADPAAAASGTPLPSGTPLSGLPTSQDGSGNGSGPNGGSSGADDSGDDNPEPGSPANRGTVPAAPGRGSGDGGDDDDDDGGPTPFVAPTGPDAASPGAAAGPPG